MKMTPNWQDNLSFGYMSIICCIRSHRVHVFKNANWQFLGVSGGRLRGEPTESNKIMKQNSQRSM